MNEIREAIAAEVKDLFDISMDVELTRPDPEFGDFATNVALQVSKQVQKNPREAAQEIVDSVDGKLPDVVAEYTIAGPGFINIRLTDKLLLESVRSGIAQTRHNQTVVIETNNPNPFKAMHIGHAFNAILGDTIANLIEASGAETHRVSYHGDVGAHVGKSMYSLLKFVEGDVAKLDEIPENERNGFMSRMYAEGAAAYKEDDEAKARIDDLAKQSFNREDELYAAVYDKCKGWSFDQIDELVGMLGNKPIERRFLESEADAEGVPIVQAHVPQVFTESDGAIVFPGSNYGSFDNVYVSARGLGLYGARDLGLMKLKNEQFHPDKSYIVTAEEQRDYFKGVIAAAELCMPEMKDVTVNISTGTVKLPTGKMSSRSGDVVEVSWLFDQVAEAVRARGGQDEDKFVAAVIRYQFLKVRIGSDVVFDITEAANIEGNSGPYLQYAHARARSILSKAGSDSLAYPESLDPAERMLALKLTEFGDVVDRATTELAPHLICTYLFELAQSFNRFYEQSHVIGDPRQAERIYLVETYANTLKHGLELLGIHAPEKM